jgi:Kef-type K+ transport system membrane component KefB/Trk K+ transport system NAD-binding subunit
MEHSPFVALLLTTSLALVIPILLNKLRVIRLPIVVGEILAGVIIGTSGLNLVEPSSILDFLSEFGFAFLMFLSGLEVDFSLLTAPLRRDSWEETITQPLPMGVMMFGLTLFLGLASGLGLQFLGLIQSPFLMGLILSTTSLGVVAPVLKERRLLGVPIGQTMLVGASIADFATLLLLTVVIAARSTGLRFDLLLIPVLLAVFVIAARAGRLAARIPRLKQVLDELPHTTAQIRVRGAFFLMIAWVVFAEMLGVELILGAFLAGAILNITAGGDEVVAQENLDAMGYGFFIPIFFIMVGVGLDLRAILRSPEALLLVPVLFVISFLVKILPALPLRLRFSWRDTLSVGFLLASRLSLIIAASAIALSIGAITPAIEADIVVIAILTCTLAPMLFNRVYHPGEGAVREGIIIVGSDQMTELLARRFKHVGDPVTVVSDDPARLREVARNGLKVVQGRADDADVLALAGAERAEALYLLTRDWDFTVDAALLARDTFGIPSIIAGIQDADLIPRLAPLGVRIVQPALATAMALEGALRFPTAFDLLAHAADDIEISEVTVRNGAVQNVPMRRFKMPGNALILSIKRDHTVMVPHDDTALQPGDVVAVIGSPESVESAVHLMRG